MRLLRGLLLASMVMVSTACAAEMADERMGLSRTADGAGLVLHLAACPGEVVEAVEVSSVEGDAVGDEDDETLWRVESEGNAPTPQKVEVGSVPAGFREVVPLEDDLPHGSLHMVFEGQPGAESELTDQWDEYPRNGKVLWGGDRLDPERFAAQVFEREPNICE